MKALAGLHAVLVFLSSSAAFSQFVITSSVPSDGATSVPLFTTVSFTFSAPLDTTMRYAESQLPISIMPTDPHTLILGAISYSPDLKTVSLQVTHTANTDFVWLVVDARSNVGQPLSRPCALNYTTSATHGAFKVGGTVTFAGGDPTNAIAGLFSGPLFGEGQIFALTGTTVPDASGTYVASNVREGVYWPLAAKDINGDGEISPDDAIGFYDPNHDGVPDSVMVSGDNLIGIDMALRRLLAPVTARTHLDTAMAIAGQYASDQELRSIGVHADPRGIDVGIDGTSLMWAYQFYSPSLQFPTMVLVSSFFTMADTTMEGFPSRGKPIPESFVDSDVAMAVADANGGHDFETHHHVVRRTLYGGNVWSERFLQDSTGIIWVAEYEALEPDGSSLNFRVFVDMITGGLITGVPALRVSDSNGHFLSQNYPNPFNPTTVIRFSLPQCERVILQVYDLLGREVATLVDEKELAAGAYSVVLNAKGFPAGVYWYRIQAGAFGETRKLIVLK